MHLTGTQPATAQENYFAIASFDDTTYAAPKLVVDYDLADVHAGNDIAVDETTSNTAVALNTAPAAGATSYALVTRQLNHPTGDNPALFYATGLSGNTAETLASITPVRNFAAGTAATTQTVPAGKTMRLQGASVNVIRTTGTGSGTFSYRVNVRVNTSGTAAVNDTTSPVIASGTAVWSQEASTATGMGGPPLWIEFIGGADIPAGASFCVTYTTLTGGTASRSQADIHLHAIEY